MAMRRLVMLGFAGLLALGVSAAEPSVRWRGFNLLDMFIWEEGHALLGERGIVQAMRGYVPMNVTHYLAY